MIRTLIATLALSATMAVACPTCGCQDAKADHAKADHSNADHTHATTQVAGKAAEACSSECAKSCDESCDQACDGKGAAVTQVAGTKAAESCTGTCPLTGAAITAVAAKGEGEACASECATECATACESGKGNASFASYIPAMGYKVGDKTTNCVKTAGAMASEQHADMHFVVQGVEYADKAEAMTAHAKQLEGMMMDLVRVQYAVNGECVACPDSAKEMAASCESKQLQYRVGPATFNNADDAIKASIMAYNAAMNTPMLYAVGNETTTCSVSAGQMAKAAHCSVEYVVMGQRTSCKTSAGYMKTLASVQNALKALETASAQTETTVSSTNS